MYSFVSSQLLHTCFQGSYSICHFDEAVSLVGDALTDVWFSLLGLSYSLAYTYKVLKEIFFSCTVDFKVSFIRPVRRQTRESGPRVLQLELLDNELEIAVSLMVCETLEIF